MKGPSGGAEAAVPTAVLVEGRGRLFWKYVALFVAVVCTALVSNGLLDIWFSYQEQKALLIRVQRGQAEAAADKITQFFKEIEGHMAWAVQLPWGPDSLNDWRFDAVRMFRQVPAVTELAQLDGNGREQIRISRESADAVERLADFSNDPAFLGAIASKIYYGPIYFVRDTEPYMTLAIAGNRRDYGVIVAQVNLKFIWDVVSQIKVGERGSAYVVDGEARLIAHPDISLVLRNTNLSHLRQIEAARASRKGASQAEADDVQHQRVLSAHAAVAPLNWLVFVELPVREALAPLYDSVLRSAALLLAALALAVLAGLFLARRMVIPIQKLRDGAARIGGGDLTMRITIKTGDELEALGDQFNRMAGQLQDLYSTLERKVQERTSQLESANQAKSRFLAAASHDLRQPLHALGLFVAQLNEGMRPEERRLLVTRIEAAIATMNELFNALLDISKLDAGVLIPKITEFPVARLFKQVETNFTGPAQEKGLSLRFVASGAWIRSDFTLLGELLSNLVSNAVRYTKKGGITVGCRRRDGSVRIDVWDTGAGIPSDQQNNIFAEFFRLKQPGDDRRSGLGLELAIVERLGRLLGHSIGLKSVVGRGSRFSVTVPQVAAPAVTPVQLAPARVSMDVAAKKLIVVLDDDLLVLEGTETLLRSWGCRVVTGTSKNAVLAALAKQVPDLIISDYQLQDGPTGIELVEQLRSESQFAIPAILVSGDTNPALEKTARASGFYFLHKPLNPMTLRALVSQALKKGRRKQPATIEAGRLDESLIPSDST